MYTVRLRPAKGQHLFISAKRKGFAALSPSVAYDMAAGESQSIILSLSPELGVRWRNYKFRNTTTPLINDILVQSRQSGDELGQIRFGLVDRQDGCKLAGEIGLLVFLARTHLLLPNDP